MIKYERPSSFIWHKILIGIGCIVLGYLALLLLQVFVWDHFYFLYLGLGLACLGYGGICILKKKTYFTKLHKGIKIMTIIFISIAVLVFVGLEYLIISQGFNKDVGKSKYVIVLGALVNGDQITLSLQYRLDAALSMYEQEEDLVFIVSGGQGKEENNSEAFYMKKYLVEKGIPSKQVLMEDKSTDTYENLKFSKKIINQQTKDKEVPITIVSNAFHMYRAKYIAQQVGFKEVYTYGAKTHLPTLPHYYIRESVGLLKDMIIRR